MKRRTIDVELPYTSPSPNTTHGFTHTSGSPCAASRSASTSASCFEFTYGMPSLPAVKSWFSSARPPGSAGPIAATLDV